MKITTKDYCALEQAIATVPQQKPAKGVSAERYRWDLLHASGFNTAPLYEYLNDSHIDTALRRIVKNKEDQE